MSVLRLEDGAKLLLQEGIGDTNADPGILLESSDTGGPWFDDPFEPPHYIWNEKDRIDIRHHRR